MRKCRYLRRYSAFFSEPKYTNVVIDGDGKQKCRYLRRCETKYAIIYVCFCADGVRKCRYLRRYSTFFSEPKYTNVVIDGYGKQKCSYLRRCETKYALFTYVFAQMECENVVIYGDNAHSFRSQNFANAVIDGDGIQKCRYLRRYERKYSIIYVCFCADGVRKCRYLRR